MKEATVNHFWHQSVKVKEAPSQGKTYNTFSRACKDDSPHPSAPLFSKGSRNDQLDKIKFD